MSSAASTVIHSVRLISSGVDRADAFVAFEDDRVLATGTGSGWRDLVGNDADVLDGAGPSSPRDCSTSTTTVAPAPHTTRARRHPYG